MVDLPTDPMRDPSLVGATVDVLAALAAGRPALELGIGDGRIAVPLAARGVVVHGIDLSADALERLRALPGGASIPVTLGDFKQVRVEGEFGLVYLVFNTIMNVTSQAGQVECFRNAARHLVSGGVFLVECMVPALRRLPPGERFVVFDGSPAHWGVDEYDVAGQGLVSHHFDVHDGQAVVSSGSFRYVWPAELDLMAELAGLEPAGRWADWTRAPFTSESASHVSAWRKP